MGFRVGVVTAGCAPGPSPPGPLLCVVGGGGRRGEAAWRGASQHGGCAAVAVTWESRLCHGGCRGHGGLAGRVTAGVGGSAFGRPVGRCGEVGAGGGGAAEAGAAVADGWSGGDPGGRYGVAVGRFGGGGGAVGWGECWWAAGGVDGGDAANG